MDVSGGERLRQSGWADPNKAKPRAALPCQVLGRRVVPEENTTRLTTGRRFPGKTAQEDARPACSRF